MLHLKGGKFHGFVLDAFLLFIPPAVSCLSVCLSCVKFVLCTQLLKNAPSTWCYVSMFWKHCFGAMFHGLLQIKGNDRALCCTALDVGCVKGWVRRCA